MVAIGVLIGVVGGLFGLAQTITPIQRETTYLMNSMWPNAETDIVDTIEAFYRGIITQDELETILRKYGFDPLRVSRQLAVTKRIFNIEQAIYLYRRKFINEEELKAIARANHVDEEQLPAWLKLTEYFPSPSDLIRFAVREVFTPEIVEKYKMLEDLPPEYLKLAEEAGIPQDVAKWYWAAHWELPSLTVGFELFRRKIISKEDLMTLMRTLDIMPGWREPLMALAYELPTRVDIRRMYELGVIDRDKVKEYYEKLGYSPEDAELLTQWTEVEYAREDRTLTSNQILELFELGELTRDEAIQWLNKLGYPIDVAEYKLRLREHEITLKEAKEALNLLIEQYKAGVISFEEFTDNAFKLPLSPQTIMRVITKTYREKLAHTKLPTVSTLKRWLYLGIINLDEFRDRLERLGYSPQDVENFVAEVNKAKGINELTEGE